MQNLACSLAGVRMLRERFNTTFRQALAFLEESDHWPLARLEAYRDEQIRSVIKHAYDTVPYYREIMEARKLRPEDIRGIDDLPKLPILEKRTIRERFHDLISKTWPKRRQLTGQTAGTTGTAVKFVLDKDTFPWQFAVWWRHYQRFGLKLGDPSISFAGRKVVPLSTLTPPFWRRNLPLHRTYVSVHHMTRQNMAPLAEYLQKRRVIFYNGYPSALYLLATYLLDHDIRLKHPPKCTITGAETVLPHQRRTIERAFETEVIDQYGASEHSCNISECEKHSYHLDMEFGAIELLPLEGMPSSLRRIVCTGFRNPAMPLIRCNIGDLATVSDRKCSCGRESPTVDWIDGRIESYVLTPDGRQLGRLDFIFKKSPNIEEAQFVQNSLDRLTVKVVKNDSYSKQDEDRLTHDLRDHLGTAIKLDIEYVPEIPREPNGKFRQIVSSVFWDRYAPAEPATRTAPRP